MWTKPNSFLNKSPSTTLTFLIEDLIEEIKIVVAEKKCFNFETYQN